MYSIFSRSVHFTVYTKYSEGTVSPSPQIFLKCVLQVSITNITSQDYKHPTLYA